MVPPSPSDPPEPLLPVVAPVPPTAGKTRVQHPAALRASNAVRPAGMKEMRGEIMGALLGTLGPSTDQCAGPPETWSESFRTAATGAQRDQPRRTQDRRSP